MPSWQSRRIGSGGLSESTASLFRDLVTKGWHCMTSSCSSPLTVTTTEGAKTEGRWHVVADCAACGQVHLVTKHGIWVMSACPGPRL